MLEKDAHGLTGIKLLDMAQCMNLSCAAHAQPPRDPRPTMLLPYEAPELLAGDRCGSEADIWAFGCVMAEMITGGYGRPTLSSRYFYLNIIPVSEREWFRVCTGRLHGLALTTALPLEPRRQTAILRDQCSPRPHQHYPNCGAPHSPPPLRHARPPRAGASDGRCGQQRCNGSRRKPPGSEVRYKTLIGQLPFTESHQGDEVLNLNLHPGP